MNPKHFFRKSPLRKSLTIALAILLVFALAFFGFWYRAHRQISLAAGQLTEGMSLEMIPEGWSQQEQRDLWTEKFWIVNQLAISKLDSMSLGICFSDSSFQLMFKGLPLIKARMCYIWPENMLTEMDPRVYAKLFSKPSVMVSDTANLPKKVFRKVRVNAEGEAVPVDSVGVVGGCLSWIFVTDNHLRFVVTGYGCDSLDLQPSVRKDLFAHHMSSISGDYFFRDDYQPTIFIWLNDADAKAIYKALPRHAAVIVRN